MTKLLPDGKMIGYILFHAFDGGYMQKQLTL